MVAAAAYPMGATAQSLDSASGWALRASLTLEADDARQKAAAADVGLKLSAFMPTVSFVGQRNLTSKISYGPDIPMAPNGSDNIPRNDPNSYGIQATLPLFDGFKRYNELQAARSTFAAGRRLQIAARQQVLLDTAAAYLGVLRDRKILELRSKQLADTETIARATEAKLTLHDVTSADGALARSRVQAARIAREQAKSQLETSSIEFRRLIGVAPGAVSAPPHPPALPPTRQAFEAEFLSESPKLQAARLDVDAAYSMSHAAKAELSPQANLTGSILQQTDITQFEKKAIDKTIKLEVTIPIYEPGAFPSITKASALAQQKDYEFQDARRKSLADAVAQYVAYRSMSAQVADARRRAAEVQRAVDNYKVEQGLGMRTVLDILDVRAELTEALIATENLVFEYRQQGYTLAAALGRLS